MIPALHSRCHGVALAMGLACASVGATAASAAMPVETQNALVQYYCAGCHSGTKLQGGLDLEGFDAAHPDPAVAGMMVEKLEGGAISAAGVPVPDKATVDDLMTALTAEAAGAAESTGGWHFRLARDAVTKGPLVVASTQSKASAAARVYEATLICHIDETHRAELRLAPAGIDAPAGASLHATYSIDAGNVQPALFLATDASTLQATLPGLPTGAQTESFKIPLPQQTLAISGVFPGETVSFPFDRLNANLRRIMGSCFSPARS